MALIICPECNREVSDIALTCVHCGYILVKKKTIGEIASGHRKVIVFFAIVVVLALLSVIFFNAGLGMSRAERAALSDIKTLQKALLDPDSIILYEVYQSFEYFENKSATLIHYGAINKSGGITDDWALVSGKEVQSENAYDKAVRDNDNSGILDNADVIWCITFGLSDKWEEINIDALQ